MLNFIPRPSEGEELVGHPRFIDGDTLALGHERIRLNGLDAPERGQLCQDAAGGSYSCGLSALAALNAQIRSGEVRCGGEQHDRYLRLIATCWIGAEDLGAWMVGHGWAAAYRRYSLKYLDQEGQARKAKAGLWSGAFEMPWDWRRSH